MFHDVPFCSLSRFDVLSIVFPSQNCPCHLGRVLVGISGHGQYAQRGETGFMAEHDALAWEMGEGGQPENEKNKLAPKEVYFFFMNLRLSHLFYLIQI